jgi:hypothetical protein
VTRVSARAMKTFRQRFSGLAAYSQDCFQVFAVGVGPFLGRRTQLLGRVGGEVFVMTKLASRGQKVLDVIEGGIMVVHLQAHHITVRGALFQQVDSQ